MKLTYTRNITPKIAPYWNIASRAKLREPWTWTRTHGKGRVFYTAWGHDHRTWENPGFQNLVERGIRWACGGDPTVVSPFSDQTSMTPLAKDAPHSSTSPRNCRLYPGGTRWGTTAQPLTTMPKPVTPDASMKHMSVPQGFSILLVRLRSLLGGKPICMNWDKRGRLWAAITRDYPGNCNPKAKAATVS
jgi:hypothetical protein